MCAATCEVLWLVNLLRELQVVVKLPVQLFCDNGAALSIAANPVFHDRTKHFELDLYFLREKISSGSIRTVSVKSEHKVADVLTKGLPAGQHEFVSSKLADWGLMGLLDIAGWASSCWGCWAYAASRFVRFSYLYMGVCFVV